MGRLYLDRMLLPSASRKALGAMLERGLDIGCRERERYRVQRERDKGSERGPV